jgi:hypothetical protein
MDDQSIARAVQLKDNIEQKIRTQTNIHHIEVGFDVLTAVSMKMAVFWVVAPCSIIRASP